MARDWKPSPAPQPTTITEIARRYHAAALALSQTLGLSLAEVLREHRESVTAVFIEASRSDLRLPASVTLPPLVTFTQVKAEPEAPPDTSPPAGVPDTQGSTGRLPPAERLSYDQARQLKALAQQVYGYREGERRLRAALGFEVDESLTLRHLAAHVRVERYRALLADYQAALGRVVASDVA